MKPTDTSEAGLETLICRALTGSDCVPRPVGTPAFVAEMPAYCGGVGWLPGDSADYDREYCVDLVQLAAFLRATQPEVAEALERDTIKSCGWGVEAGKKRAYPSVSNFTTK